MYRAVRQAMILSEEKLNILRSISSRRSAELDAKARKIVEILSAEQKDLVLRLSSRPVRIGLGPEAFLGYSIEKLGLANRTLFGDDTYLTELGIKVNELLKQKNNDS